jgi:hypothetical protein
MDIERKRSYKALSWRSDCLDTYRWRDHEGNTLCVEIVYFNGDVPRMMTGRELNQHLCKWSQYEAPGRFYINGQEQEKPNKIEKLCMIQLNELSEEMHKLNHRCVDWTIDCDNIKIVVSVDQTINLQVKNFDIHKNSDAQDIYHHILLQVDLFTRG